MPAWLDRVEVMVIPVMLGGGVPLMPEGRRCHLHLEECQPYPSGVISLKYSVRTDNSQRASVPGHWILTLERKRPGSQAFIDRPNSPTARKPQPYPARSRDPMRQVMTLCSGIENAGYSVLPVSVSSLLRPSSAVSLGEACKPTLSLSSACLGKNSFPVDNPFLQRLRIHRPPGLSPESNHLHRGIAPTVQGYSKFRICSRAAALVFVGSFASRNSGKFRSQSCSENRPIQARPL